MIKIIKGAPSCNNSYNEKKVLVVIENQDLGLRLEAIEEPCLFTEIVGTQSYLFKTNDAEYLDKDLLRYVDNSKDLPDRLYYNDEEDDDGGPVHKPLPDDFKILLDRFDLTVQEQFYFRLEDDEIERVKKIADATWQMILELHVESGARGRFFLVISTRKSSLGEAVAHLIADMSYEHGKSYGYESNWDLALSNSITKAGKPAAPMKNWLEGTKRNFEVALVNLKKKAIEQKNRIAELDKEIERLQAKKNQLLSTSKEVPK